MKKNEKGFGAVEGMLIVIIVLLVGFIGYYVYHTKNNTDKTLNTAAQTTVATTNSDNSKETLADAVKQAQVVFDADAKATSSSHAPITSNWGKQNDWAYLDLQFINAHKSWFTDKYVASVNNSADNQLSVPNGFLECVNAMFSTMTAEGVSLDTNTAKINVTENGQISDTFSVQMKYQSGQWQIDVVDLSSCS